MTILMNFHIWNNTFTPWQRYQNITALPAFIFFYWPEKWFVTRDSERLVKVENWFLLELGYFFPPLDL